jgi:hypothetical protein
VWQILYLDHLLCDDMIEHVDLPRSAFFNASVVRKISQADKCTLKDGTATYGALKVLIYPCGFFACLPVPKYVWSIRFSVPVSTFIQCLYCTMFSSHIDIPVSTLPSSVFSVYVVAKSVPAQQRHVC